MWPETLRISKFFLQPSSELKQAAVSIYVWDGPFGRMLRVLQNEVIECDKLYT